jgi:prolycopene isomerase
MLCWVIPFLKTVKTPVEKGLRRYFRTEHLRRIFCSQETFMGVIGPVAWAFEGDFQACPKGGSRALVSWLCDSIGAAGSKVLLNQRVERVLLKDGREVAGVLLENGKSVSTRYVIAACDIQALYEEMLPDGCIPAQLRRALNNADIYPSSFSIFLGLDCDPASLGFEEEILHLITNNVSRGDHTSGDPHRTIIVVVAPSLRDPSLAPKGKGTLIIHCPAYIDYQDNWRTGEGLTRGEAYKTLKREFADILLDRIEDTFAPGLKKHIEVMEIATPVTYRRYSGNVKGTIMGVKPTFKNVRAGVAHCKTPVKNLLLGGHCAEYGGGVPIAVKAGANASLIVMKEKKKAEYERLKHVMDGKVDAASG